MVHPILRESDVYTKPNQLHTLTSINRMRQAHPPVAVTESQLKRVRRPSQFCQIHVLNKTQLPHCFVIIISTRKNTGCCYRRQPTNKMKIEGASVMRVSGRWSVSERLI